MIIAGRAKYHYNIISAIRDNQGEKKEDDLQLKHRGKKNVIPS